MNGSLNDEEIAVLIRACEKAELVMDTATMLGVKSILPPAYRDNWVAAHVALREAIILTGGRS